MVIIAGKAGRNLAESMVIPQDILCHYAKMPWQLQW
jgi:hypothetical protein